MLVRTLKAKGSAYSCAAAGEARTEIAAAVAEGAVLGGWEASKYKSDPKKDEQQIDDFYNCYAGQANTTALRGALERGRVIAESQNLTRDLVNEPANKLTPAVLADAASRMAAETGLECEVLDEKAMAALGMGALLGVAQGSTNPPFLIVLKYRPTTTHGHGSSGAGWQRSHV